MRETKAMGWSYLLWGIIEGFSEEVALHPDIAQ